MGLRVGGCACVRCPADDGTLPHCPRAVDQGNTTEHNIKAAVMHHAYTHSYPAPQVPFLAMTSALDATASPK